MKTRLICKRLPKYFDGNELNFEWLPDINKPILLRVVRHINNTTFLYDKNIGYTIGELQILGNDNQWHKFSDTLEDTDRHLELYDKKKALSIKNSHKGSTAIPEGTYPLDFNYKSPAFTYKRDTDDRDGHLKGQLHYGGVYIDPKVGYARMIGILNVPNYQGILAHGASSKGTLNVNTNNTLGCLLVGDIDPKNEGLLSNAYNTWVRLRKLLDKYKSGTIKYMDDYSTYGKHTKAKTIAEIPFDEEDLELTTYTQPIEINYGQL